MIDLGPLELDLDWITRVIDLRFRLYFKHEQAEGEPQTLEDVPPPVLAGDGPYVAFVREHATALPARMALALSLVPHLRPPLMDVFLTKNATFDRRFTDFGGIMGDDGLEPTGDTVAWLLDGGSVESRVAVAALFDLAHPFIVQDALRPTPTHRHQPLMKAPLRLSPDHLTLFTQGQRPRPTLGADFPAQHITTTLTWDDLVLPAATRQRIQEIQVFLTHRHTLLHEWGLAARLRPGYRALFYGPPGTGKTLAVTLLGRLTGCDVYRVDLSLVVSKYIGETEKNLGRVFDRAQMRDWILFFDEADALFGKRTETRDAHDRYANQEVAYLLQRIETFDGVVVLASNLRSNIDEAFARRFESVVYFPAPRADERLLLWRKAWPTRAKLDASVDLGALARDHELTGASIMNVIRNVALDAIADGERMITRDDIVRAIRRELAKEGKES